MHGRNLEGTKKVFKNEVTRIRKKYGLDYENWHVESRFMPDASQLIDIGKFERFLCMIVIVVTYRIFFIQNYNQVSDIKGNLESPFSFLAFFPKLEGYLGSMTFPLVFFSSIALENDFVKNKSFYYR